MVVSLLWVLQALHLSPLASGSLFDRSPVGHSVPLPLDAFFNNKGYGSYPGEAALSALNESFPADSLALNGIYTSKSSGISYLYPGYNPDPKANDNVICNGQVIDVDPSVDYASVSFLAVSDVRSSTAFGNVTFLYTDNTTSQYELRAPAFWWFLAIRRGEITYPYSFTYNDTNHNASEIYERYAPLPSNKSLRGMVLPTVTNSTTGRLHVFAISLWQAGASGVEVQAVRPTQKIDEAGRQIVEVTVNHRGPVCVINMEVSLEARGLGGKATTIVKRFCPGDQKRVNIAVQGESEGDISVTLKVPDCKPVHAVFPDTAIGLETWEATSTSLVRHESPEWYDGAKFGIFIHYGVYAVPGWGNSTPTECYAEWFWWYSTRIGDFAAADRCGFNAYRLRTFGPDLNYDDFFENYTASVYDPKSWVDLFADAGAQYFVFTTKHHEGFANFDAGNTTNRSAMHYGPKRDLLGELFDAAETYQPHLKRGTYFSLPEWFNPDWGKYGFTQYDRATSTSQPGIIARNPYTGLNEPYTGRLPISDFIEDLMVPQMNILAYNYKTDIMWCDAGASNGTDVFAASWFNWARSQSRQVTINDRCGSPWAADFDTPEYQTFSTAQQRKWESNRGMDPFSYGFNRATVPEDYANASSIILELVDIVSKNGNLLLNIGPRADGSIHETMVSNLRETGTWVHAHKEAIFNTTYWSVTPEEGNLRFTQTNDAFYALSLEEPAVGPLVVESPIPVQAGDVVSAITMNGTIVLSWGLDEGNGTFFVNVTEEVIAADKYCWVFKIEYKA